MSSWQPLSDLHTPYLMRWVTATPHGFASSAMMVDAPQCGGDGEKMVAGWARCLGVWWSPMATFDSEITIIEAIPFRLGHTDARLQSPNVKGTLLGGTAPMDRSAVWMVLTGHNDSWGKRRVYLPGTPASWVSGGVLEDDAQARHQGVARGFISELGHNGGYQQIAGYVYRPAMPGHENIEFRTAGVRRFKTVRVLTYTDRPAGLEGFF